MGPVELVHEGLVLLLHVGKLLFESRDPLGLGGEIGVERLVLGEEILVLWGEVRQPFLRRRLIEHLVRVASELFDEIPCRLRIVVNVNDLDRGVVARMHRLHVPFVELP